MPRLQAAVLGVDGPLSYALRFGRDASGQAVALGQVRGVVRLLCQRCLGVLECPVDATIALALVRAPGAPDHLGLMQVEGVDEGLDPLPVGDEPLHPFDLIEDEVLLALPQVPRHPPGQCQALPAAALDEVPSVPVDEGANPFAVLAALKRP